MNDNLCAKFITKQDLKLNPIRFIKKFSKILFKAILMDSNH